MLIIMTSPHAVLSNGVPDPDLVKALIDTRIQGNPVGLISNNDEPSWFHSTFAASGVQFLKVTGRQSGDIVAQNAKQLSVSAHDVLVLAVKGEDIQMGKNGGAVLVAAGWSNSQLIKNLGIQVNTADELKEVISLTAGWNGQWWFDGVAPAYGIRALADLSGYGKGITQQTFAQKVTQTVKNGGSRLNALLAITSRSLLMEGVASKSDLVWGVYPSSSSKNDDTETLSDFTHRLRTTVSRVRYSKRGEPLFIRHTASPKRSAGGGGDRTDPSNQILTMHLNPFYQKSDRLIGKHVIVVDDCTTYGVSFGVAAAFLRKAGAASVTGIALGKFGNQLRYYEIDITSDPYSPITNAGFSVKVNSVFTGKTNTTTQQTLHTLIP